MAALFIIYVANTWLPSKLVHGAVMMYYTAYSAGHLGDLLESALPASTAARVMRKLPLPILKIVAVAGIDL